jgi:hypothetical protein
MLYDLGSVLLAERDRVICAEGVYYVEVVGNLLCLSERCP